MNRSFRCIAATILFVSASISTTAAEDSAIGSTAFDRSNATLAAKLLIARIEKEALQTPVDAALLTQVMLADPAKFVKCDQSQDSLRSVYRNELSRRFAAEAGVVLDRLASSQSRIDAFGEEFAAAATNANAKALEGAVDKSYLGVFKAARVAALDEQRRSIEAKIQPSEQEFEQTERGALAAMLTERIASAQSIPVFEENLGYISENFVRPLIEAAETQRAAQSKYVKSVLTSGWMPETIQTELEASLAQFVEESVQTLRAKGQTAYATFPSVAASLSKVAQQRAEERVARLVREASVEVDEAAMLRAIESDPKTHRAKKDSIAVFKPQLAEKLRASCIDRAVALAAETEASRVRAWIPDFMDKSDKVRHALSTTVDKDLVPAIERAREACAQRQAKRLFPTLCDRSWWPTGALVDSIASRSNRSNAYLAWREFAELEDAARTANAQPLMEETDRLVAECVRRALESGFNARDCQLALVDDYFLAVRAQIKAMPTLPPLQSIVEIYRGKVVAAWNDEREEVLWGKVPELERPKNAAEQHASLFQSVEEKIELKSRSILEALEKERQEEKKPEEEKDPKDTPPQDTPPELVELECDFEMVKRGRDIVVRSVAEGETLAEAKCSDSPGNFRADAQRTARSVADETARKLRARIGPNTHLSVRTSLLVKDPLVYYGMVTAMARALQDSAEALEREGITLEIGGASAPDEL